MIDRTPDWIATAAGGELVAGGASNGPHGASVDTRTLDTGELFFGISGQQVDGGGFAAAALAAGAWGVVVEPSGVQAATTAAVNGQPVIVVSDAARALGALAAAWRQELGCEVIAVTGSTGKTSTKDILAALLSRQRVVVSTAENLNTEIGLPLTVLAAPRGTQVLVLEMAMRGIGQIAELTAIARPDVGCITNIGPVHAELLGSVENIAAAKAELIAGLEPGAMAVLPSDEPLLDRARRPDVRTVTFGPGGDVRVVEARDGFVRLVTPSGPVRLRPSFSESYNMINLAAAVTCAQGVGVQPTGELTVTFSKLRGQVLTTLSGAQLVNDCYNANPLSMKAALDNLASIPARRRIAVLGGMSELGERSSAYHAEIGKYVSDTGTEILLAVGDLAHGYLDGFSGDVRIVDSPSEAADWLRATLQAGDVALVKGSRSVGLEAVATELEVSSGG